MQRCKTLTLKILTLKTLKTLILKILTLKNSYS